MKIPNAKRFMQQAIDAYMDNLELYSLMFGVEPQHLRVALWVLLSLLLIAGTIIAYLIYRVFII